MEPRRVAIRRIAIYAAVWIASSARSPSPATFRARTRRATSSTIIGALGPILYVPLFVLVNFAVAWPILAGAAGLLFGTAVGTPLALLGVTAAALTQMAIARKLGR